MSKCEACGRKVYGDDCAPFICPECGSYNEAERNCGFRTKSDDEVDYGDYVETW